MGKLKLEKVRTINHKKNEAKEKIKIGLFYYHKDGRITTVFMI